MASTASVPPASVGAANMSEVNQTNGPGRSTTKISTSNSKAAEGRKQSPVDGGQKRTLSQKAWTSGTNPLTQRSNSTTQTNGVNAPPKPASSAKTPVKKEAGMSDKHAHDRLTFIMGAAFGSIVTVATKTGDHFEGVLAGSNLQAADTKITLKMTKKQAGLQSVQMNGTLVKNAALVGSGPDHAMCFDQRDLTDISIAELGPPELPKNLNNTASSFQTDSDISRNLDRGERKLQRWVPETNDNVDLSLELSGAVGWDQFETNKAMFGTSSTYDENDYTTPLDRNAPSYKQREAEAARIAREIETASSTNTHVREERGQALAHDGDDEEDKYSGVRRNERNFPPLKSGMPNMYTPPARRAPTGQPTVHGAPVDPAIISAQLSRPDSVKAAVPKNTQKADAAVPGDGGSKTQMSDSVSSLGPAVSPTEPAPAASTSLAAPDAKDQTNKPRSVNASVSPSRKPAAENPTEDVENKVLDHFRQFANAEKLKHAERRRVQATQDRAAKLHELKRFSTTFKLKTPIPTDLVGILAKDPHKQEQIIEKAQKEHQESASTTASPASTLEAKTPRVVTNPKFDPATIPPPLVERHGHGRGRGGFAPIASRPNQQQQSLFPGRGLPNLFSQRPNGLQQERKHLPLHTVPNPIPLQDARAPPTGPMADQSGLSSPQRSSVHTPTSAVSTKFNVKAIEFRPNANAPTFNPSGTSEAPSSPAVSVQRTRSASRSASPSAFFGPRKPKPTSERPSIVDHFNPIPRMKEETAKEQDPHKNYSANGGIPNAYQTGPRWDVEEANTEKTYTEAFEKQATPVVSPVQSRSSSTQQVPYPNQMPHHVPNGQHMMPPVSTPHRTPSHPQNMHYSHQGEDHHGRMPVPMPSPQVYPASHAQPGQMIYPSPMNHPAQLAYGPNMPGYFNPGNQTPMQMRPYHGAPQFMHTQGGQLAAPMMVQQHSSGPYMPVPPQYNGQMPMYSPSPAHVYPQQNGYPSPGRAPMMMHQNSQQGHHGPQVVYAMPNQGGQMLYPPPGGAMGGMRGYPAQQGPYASSPHQPHHFTQRAMSNGYGGQMSHKMIQQQSMPGGHGMAGAHAQQHAGYAAVDGAGEEAK